MTTEGCNSVSKSDDNALICGTTGQVRSSSAPPPMYSTLPEAVAAQMSSLSVGDPTETINVPMVLSTEVRRKRDIFYTSSKRPAPKQTVIVRRMTREFYLKHYAKDLQGNYVGTEKPAVDAGLVYVAGKGSSEELLEQVRKVAVGKQHDAGDFGPGAVGGAWGASC